VGGLSTNGANRKIGRPGGVALCDKTNQTVGVRGPLFGYFLGKQKVTKEKMKQQNSISYSKHMLEAFKRKPICGLCD